MKIAQVCHRYHPYIGGVETHVKEISERLVSMGHLVEVITTDPSGNLPKKEIINGVKVTRFRSFAPGEAYYLAPHIYFYLKHSEYDIIHAHNYHAFPALFAAFAKCQSRFIFTPHYHRGGHTFVRNLLHKPYKLLGKMILSRADNVVSVSEYEKKLLTSDFDNIDENIQKIPNGINLTEFKDIKPLKKEVTQKTLLYVGRLEEYKGVQNIIASLQSLPEYKLNIIGSGSYETKLHELADDLNVSGQIEWLKDVARYELLQNYASADVFVMLSLHEAYGITVAEALASGTPCVVALGSALDEFVDGEMCVGLNKFDIDTITSAIRELGARETRKLQNTIDWNDVVNKLVELYGN